VNKKELNTLYYGDNLTILRKYIPDESVDLIYLDPPFNSNATYNVLFKEPGTGEQSAAQITAFEDTWHWTSESERAFQEIVNTAPATVVLLMRALREVFPRSDMMAYLTMICIRLLELKRVLKSTGSLYLHCDPTASHYLRIVLDAVFGKENFRNEIIWKKTNSPKAQAKGLGKQHDVIFLYSKNIDFFSMQRIYKKPDENYLKSFRYDDKDGKGRYQTVALSNVTSLGGFAKMKTFEWRGVTARWIYSKENLDKFWEEGRIYKTKSGMYRLKKHLKDIPGQIVSDIWVDKEVSPLQGGSSEFLSYQTQKPEALLERIIKASSKEGDTVLDPFCGCGTAVVAAHRLKRNWIGIDITHLAISLMKWRLKTNFPDIAFSVVGEPVDLAGAEALAKENRYQFQWWALSLIGARPFGDKKKGADTGIDGFLFFNDAGETKKAVVSVKSGKVGVSQIRELIRVVEREKAEMGFFLTLKTATAPMKEEAAEVGFYLDSFGNKYLKLQIFTIEELLKGKQPETPQKIGPFHSFSNKNKTKKKNKRNNTFRTTLI